MSAAAITGTATSAAAGSRSVGNSFGELDSQEFVKILVTELTNQDPFKPNDSAQILEQLGTLRNIESQTSLQQQLQSLVLQNQISQASSMIGKQVQGLGEDNRQLAGLVTAVRVRDGQAVLELDTGQSLPMERVQTIAEKPAATSGS